jgi:hypothetical protein
MTHSVNPLNSSTFVTCFQGQKEEHVKGSTQWRSEIVIILLFPNTIVALNHSFTCFMQFEVCTRLFPWTNYKDWCPQAGEYVYNTHPECIYIAHPEETAMQMYTVL